MDKLLKDLPDAIYKIMDGNYEATLEEAEDFGNAMKYLILNRFNGKEREPTLSMSNVGTPCNRKLWYHVNKDPSTKEQLRPETRLKFLYGDIVEEMLLWLTKRAGYRVEGEQDPMKLGSLKGSRDCVIEGTTVDIKSSSSFGMKKFKGNGLYSDDPFNYLQQITSYVNAGKDDPLVTNKDSGGFLVIDKVGGSIVYDEYVVDTDEETIKDFVQEKQDVVALSSEPPRGHFPTKDGASGNMKLCTQCSYCDWKFKCWPQIRTFLYANGPRHLTTVVRRPSDSIPEVVRK